MDYLTNTVLHFHLWVNCINVGRWLVNNKHKMGYIKDDGTLTDVTFAYYDWLSIDPLKEPDCSDCKYLPICGGGCRMVILSANRNISCCWLAKRSKAYREADRSICAQTKYSFKTTDCLLSLYQYTQCIGIHRIHGIAQKGY